MRKLLLLALPIAVAGCSPKPTEEAPTQSSEHAKDNVFFTCTYNSTQNEFLVRLSAAEATATVVGSGNDVSSQSAHFFPKLVIIEFEPLLAISRNNLDFFTGSEDGTKMSKSGKCVIDLEEPNQAF
jgi:hypothetical protein